MERATLINFLEKTFPGSEVRDLDVPPGGTRMGGTLIWEGFKDLDHLDRQNQLWDALQDKYDRAELRSIGLIMTFTLDEVQAITIRDEMRDAVDELVGRHERVVKGTAGDAAADDIPAAEVSA